ncbi:M14 family metallopeptidase [Myxococcota bacterium]|nr:M14 family metallopeptidase [Myxococcota bacterium]
MFTRAARLFAFTALLGVAHAAPPEDPYLRHVERLTPPSPHPARAEGYGFYAELHQRIAAVLQEHPGRVSAERYGLSVEGRRLWAVRVRDPGVETRHRLLVIAQLHALEWLGSEVAVALIEALGPRPASGVELIIVPVANPDGRANVEADLIAGDDRTYRRGNANQVDLNRDFAVNRDADTIWARLPYTRQYYQTSPDALSQPETQALDALAQAHRIDVSVSLHAFGGYIYVPWAGDRARHPDYAALMALGEVMAEGQARPYRVMQLCRWIFFFRALGTELDHMSARLGASSFLIELGRSGVRPLAPDTWRDPFRWYNPEDPSPHVEDGLGAVLALARHLAYAPAPQRDDDASPVGLSRATTAR